MDRGAWWTTYSPWGYKESETTERLTLSKVNEPGQRGTDGDWQRLRR